MKRVIKTAASAAMYNPVSQATVAANGMLYTAGMIGRSPESGEMLPSFAEQAHQALRNLGVATPQRREATIKTSCSCSSICLTWARLSNSTKSSKSTFLLIRRPVPYVSPSSSIRARS